MSQANPKVSVVVTCFNLGQYLNEAVDSVLRQTFQDFEIIVVDDGSTDPATRALLAEYSRPKTRVVHTENRGLPGARNVGIREAVGEYVCAVDADDILEPTLLERSIRVLEEDSTVTFVSHWLKTFGDQEWEWTPKSCDFPVLLDHNTVNGAAPVRRSTLLEVGLFDESMRDGCEDWDLWITMVERGFRGVILPEFLFRYRRRSSSMSRLMAKESVNIETLRYMVRKHADTYRRHLWDLASRRILLAGDLLAHTHDLYVEEDRWLRREVSQKREHLEALRASVERARRAAAVQSRIATLEATFDENRALHTAHVKELQSRIESLEQTVTDKSADRARLEDQIREDADRLANLNLAWDGARREALALRNSFSWKLMYPARVIHSWLRTRGRG